MKNVKLQLMNGGQYMITVPKMLIDLKKWKKGQHLKWVIYNNKLCLTEEK